MSRKKYVQVGLGGRAGMFFKAIATRYRETAELVAFCDLNPTRTALANRYFVEKFGMQPLPTYGAEQFDEMIRKERPDCVIVTSIDRTHHKYLIRAMELGCDAITEKPMTIDAEKCQAILDTVKATGRKLRVTFNYRYAPKHTKIRELIRDGAIGRVTQVHFEWLLDTKHGADYFRRWHRDKRNSGGLMVHKATHHFDLVNFWLGTQPKTVFGMGDLLFYGRENAENRGMTRFYQRAYGSELAKDDPFAVHLEKNEHLKNMYLEAEQYDGYQRDQNVFGDGISIEDTMSVLVRYKNKAMLTYSLTAYAPWEGYNISFTGEKGRIEASTHENSYINAGGKSSDEGAHKSGVLLVRPHWDKPYEVEIPKAVGGHGGADDPMLDDIFGNAGPDPFERSASHIDGALSILTGIAANRSFATGQPVEIDSLVKL